SIGGGSTKRFYDLVINSGASVTNTSGNIEINRDFTNNGSFTQSASRMTTFETAGGHALSGTGSTQFGNVDIPGVADVDANTHDFSVVGNFTITGTFTGDSSTVTFNGSSAQTVGGSGTAVFNNLTLNNSSGLILNGDFSVEGVMALTDGRFDLADHHLTLGDAASVAGSLDASKMVVATCTGTTGEGELRKEYTSTGSPFTFPIGDDNGTAEYSPVDLTFSSGDFASGAYVSVCVVDAVHPENDSPTDYLTRYWTVEQSGISNFSATPTFHYVQDDVEGTENNIYGAKWDGSWTLLNQVDETNNQFSDTVISFSDFTGGEQAFVPVTLNFFQAEHAGEQVQFTWQTATETANMGFNLYVEDADGLQQINTNLILSPEMSSLRAVDYSYSAEFSGDVFYIEDVDVFGKTKRRGPFALGQAYGRQSIETPIDWAAINAEHNAKTAERHAAGFDVAQTRVQNAANDSSGPLLTLGVSQTGLYRVTHAALLAAGLDLSGSSLADIAIAQGTTPVPIRVSGSGGVFGTDSFIEFYGQAIDTLYSKENIYTLHLDASLAARASEDSTPPGGGGTPAAYYMETLSLGDDNKYDVASHGDSPWYDSRLVAYNNPASKSFTIPVDNYVAGTVPASLQVALLGLSALPETPDHHVLVDVGSTAVADITFDGVETYTLDVALAEGLLAEGANTLTITLPDDLGVLWDVVGVDSYGATYPRAFVAKADGQLTFNATETAFQVDGLPGAAIVVYRVDAAGTPTRLTDVTVTGAAGSYSAAFAGSGDAATYLVYSENHLLTPALRPARPTIDITSGTADYLIIAHADFSDGLAPLVAFHQNNGLSVKVVDVADIFDQYSAGVFDPAAIKAYLQTAAASMGVEYVLLVGGDTYDYDDNLGLGSISFIPSPYMSTGPIVGFAPVDPLYVDVDGDYVPDMKLGRFPVRSSAELMALIDKTLTYAAADYKETAVFAADIQAERSYTEMSSGFADYLPAQWQVETAYLDEMPVADARSALIDSINGGVGLTSYVGHSGPSRWTWLGLFNADDAGNLANVGQPTAVTQWGCWNTYHVHPAYDTLGQQFMLGDSGAAVVLGAATLTEADHENRLGQAFMAHLVEPGTTFGDALLLAKNAVENTTPGLLDVQLGYTLLGDPALALTDDTSCAPAPTPTNVSITQDSGDITLSWEDMAATTGADVAHYEVWRSPAHSFYFTPAGACVDSADCTVVDGTSHTLAASANHAYVVLAVNSCGGVSPVEAAPRVGTFNFALHPGVAAAHNE
ncbi:MAG: hypothetical protein KDE48_19250, partial [Anaerolineales bacterium]|nr:hypothetical protein [Anaerolineales bacterium]